MGQFFWWRVHQYTIVRIIVYAYAGNIIWDQIISRILEIPFGDSWIFDPEGWPTLTYLLLSWVAVIIGGFFGYTLNSQAGPFAKKFCPNCYSEFTEHGNNCMSCGLFCESTTSKKPFKAQIISSFPTILGIILFVVINSGFNYFIWETSFGKNYYGEIGLTMIGFLSCTTTMLPKYDFARREVIRFWGYTPLVVHHNGITVVCLILWLGSVFYLSYNFSWWFLFLILGYFILAQYVISLSGRFFWWLYFFGILWGIPLILLKFIRFFA